MVIFSHMTVIERLAEITENVKLIDGNILTTNNLDFNLPHIGYYINGEYKNERNTLKAKLDSTNPI